MTACRRSAGMMTQPGHLKPAPLLQPSPPSRRDAMTASNVHDLVETWRCAIRLLPSDPRALAALLKSDTPMPHGVRYLIGEISHRGTPPLIDITAKPKRTKAVSKAVDKLNVSREYERRRYAI